MGRGVAQKSGPQYVSVGPLARLLIHGHICLNNYHL